jgi:hypothetical protein
MEPRWAFRDGANASDLQPDFVKLFTKSAGNAL